MSSGDDEVGRPSLRERWDSLVDVYRGMFLDPYRRALHREYREVHDAFLVSTFPDALGIPNPVMLHTLELYPYLIEHFHQWHRRAGMERAPEGGFRCC